MQALTLLLGVYLQSLFVPFQAIDSCPFTNPSLTLITLQPTPLTTASYAPDSAATLSFNWTLAKGANHGITEPAVDGPSNARIELQSGPDVYPCSNSVVSARTLGSTTYAETVSCTLPAYLPSSDYLLWVCLDPFGCGYNVIATTNYSLTVPMTVSSLTPIAGSLAGGVDITIAGTGFDQNATNVAVTIGGAACAVTAATTTEIRCRTGALATPPSVSTPYDVMVRPSRGSVFRNSGQQFTYDPALTPTASAVSPTRGSTEGGTLLAIEGTGFPTSEGATVEVMVGSYPCNQAIIMSATHVTCRTTNPGKPKPIGPLPLSLRFSGMGAAATTATYQYLDLWSRTTTWDGKEPPKEGETVYIGPEYNVVLDVSPPKLGLLVIQGNLTFDPSVSADTEIWLQASWILVKGGNLVIGSPSSPYPGKARITLHGPPDSRELPLYGAKTIAVRDGNVSMSGQPKTPTWTVLATTADVDANAIELVGQVNWKVGDVVVIASSSFFAEETDELAIAEVG